MKTSLPNGWIRNEKSEPPIINFPQILNLEITTMVDKPEVPRTREAMAGEEDVVLVLEDVEYDPTKRVHFDVLINVVNDQPEVGPMHHEFVGIFHNLAHGHLHHEKTSLRFVITDVIQGLGLEHHEKLAVRIEPKSVSGSWLSELNLRLVEKKSSLEGSKQ
ncbi:unnamed protein product [Citrullus colocynthis]|uniref:Polyphenol oxidase C-terminal domain-containing protein n=1 Tax=Citrullus colocynthis TaxID=252529 RepID=A0ABP0Z406_9ROSI